jgi:hypothetical protein
MTTKQFLIAIGFVLFIGGCTERKSEESAADYSTQAMETDVIGNASEAISSSAAVETNNNGDRKFIRTAELKFKVKNVAQSSYAIESIASKYNGFVSYTNLESVVNSVDLTTISADSSLETTYYTVVNAITIRIPNTKLDTVLKEISKHVDYLDYRIIKADDVSLQILSNDLTQKRSVITTQKSTARFSYDKQEIADNAKIANMSLNDQINFSTISLSIYQRPTIKRELISNSKNIEAYEPGFGLKILASIKSGWKILQTVILFVVNLWGVFAAGLALYFLYKFIAPRFKK